MMKSALEIANNTFDERKVRFVRIMHVETNLLDGIGYVWTSESGILKGASKTAIERWVRNKRTGCRR
jgi:hypothetical protein